ncbi:MAG: tetratricopeptide repeat protein, partial [Proteobacteria bacterium]|nr:tetratricopeptide repeat protein [Pseudomonadota bacterium]
MSELDTLAKAGIQAINDKEYDKAIESFLQALELEPDRPDINNALGMAYLHRGDAGNAIPHLQRAVELAEPYDAPEAQEMKCHFHVQLATAYQLMDRVKEAVTVLKQIIERWPQKLEARMQLGSLLLSACQLDEGVEVYRGTFDMFEDKKDREAAEALTGAITAFVESEHEADIFLVGHQ